MNGTSLWRNRDFRCFWFGESLSLLGSHVTTLALPLTAIEVFGAGDAQVGLLRFLQLAPYLVLALLFGVWVDRNRRRSVMLGANTARLLLLTLIAVLYGLDALTMGLLLVLACAVGIASVLFDVSWMSYVPSLLRDKDQLVEASTKLGTTSSAADIAGPGLAGLLVGALTAPVAIVVDAVSYLVSIVSLSLIRTREPRPERPRTVRLRVELREGLAWVFGNGVLRSLALIGFCCNFLMTAVWTMFVIYGTRDAALSAAGLGAIFAAASVGGLIGSAMSGTVVRRYPIGRVYLVAQTALFLGPVMIPAAAGPRHLLIGFFVLSFFVTYLGLGVANVVIVSLRQAVTPQSIMGRMTGAFRTLLFGGGALGGLCGGLLSGAIGTRGALVVAATLSALVVPAIVVSPVSRLRMLPQRQDEDPRAPAPRQADVG